jgi:hypothetical protein
MPNSTLTSRVLVLLVTLLLIVFIIRAIVTMLMPLLPFIGGAVVITIIAVFIIRRNRGW